MVVSTQIFPGRKRRPSAGSFVSPKVTDLKLLRSLVHLTHEISSIEPLQFLLRRNSLSVIRKSNLLKLLFEEMVRNSVAFFSPSTLLCLEEMYIVLQRMKTLMEDCSTGSKMWLLMQSESAANSFQELTVELSTLLDILPVRELYLSDDVEEIVCLLRKQCSKITLFVDPRDVNLRLQVSAMIDRIRKEIVPSQVKLKEIFEKLGLRDDSSCREEIEQLEEEIQNQIDDRSQSDIVSLIGLIRYAKCVLYASSSSTSKLPENQRRRRLAADSVNVPSDFRCPISLELMRDPVVVATGQTYDRASINLWIESGHNTCPKTGQTLAHTNLIPNRSLRNLITMWCREHRLIPLETAETNDRLLSVKSNKAALEATKMTALFLVNKLSSLASKPTEALNGVIYELRVLAKTDSESRARIGETGAIPMLVRYLGSDVGSDSPNLQVNAVTTILNLSILEENKTRIMETDGALNGVIEVLRSGATWEAKGNAAATIFSLSGVPAYRKRLSRKARVVRGLMDLARDGPTGCKKDALVAILNLAGDRETVGKLVEGGVVEMAGQVMGGIPEEALTILEVVMKRGGVVAVAAGYGLVGKVAEVLRDGSDTARECAAATLVTMCRKGGSEMAAALAAVRGIERVIWELLGTGTVRGRRKAATLLRVIRRWASGLDATHVDDFTSSTTVN